MINKVLFTGDYDKEYNRTQIIAIGLEKEGVEVLHFVFKKHNRETKNRIKEISQNVDLIFLPSFTHKDVKFIKKTSNKPLLFDPLISRYLTKVFDFNQVSKYSPRAYKNYLKDKIAFKYADKIIADTEEHKKYFNTTFNISNNKISIIPIGTDCSVFYPTHTKPNNKFTVGFYGGFIPLQGVSNIVSAAKLLIDNNDIEFRLIGSGYEYNKIKNIIEDNNINNIKLIGWAKYEELPKLINEFDVCLGIFGNTPKTEKVIPNKVFHYAACNKPIITKDTPGITEIFEHNKNILLTTSNPEEIAKAIIYIKDNKEESNRIASSAFDLVSKNYNTEAIARRFIEIAQELILTY